MVPKLFYELGLTDWNDEAQREEYETAVNRAIRSVLDTRFDFRKPWREQKQKLEAVDAFQKELSKYQISKEKCEEYLRNKCLNKVKNENRKKKSRNKAKRTLRSRSTSPRCTSSSEPDNYDGSLFHTMDELAPIRSTDFVPIRNLPDDASIREQQQANTIDSTSTPPFSWTYSICSPAHYAVMSTCAGRRFDNLSSPGGSLSPLDLYRNGSSSSEGSSIASTFDDLPFPPNQQMEKVRCDNYIPLNVVNDSLTTFHVKPNSVSPNVIDPVFENTTQALSENWRTWLSNTCKPDQYRYFIQSNQFQTQMRDDESVQEYIQRSLHIAQYTQLENDLGDRDVAVGIILGMSKPLRSEIARVLREEVSMDFSIGDVPIVV